MILLLQKRSWKLSWKPSRRLIRIREYQTVEEAVLESLKEEQVIVEKAPYVARAYYVKNYDYLPALTAFRRGSIQVQDVSSMLAGEIAAVKEGIMSSICAPLQAERLCIWQTSFTEPDGVDARDLSRPKPI